MKIKTKLTQAELCEMLERRRRELNISLDELARSAHAPNCVISGLARGVFSKRLNTASLLDICESLNFELTFNISDKEP